MRRRRLSTLMCTLALAVSWAGPSLATDARSAKVAAPASSWAGASAPANQAAKPQPGASRNCSAARPSSTSGVPDVMHRDHGVPGTQALDALYKGKKPGALEERTDLVPKLTETFVRKGVSVMPPFRKTEITDADLAALAAYLAPKTP